MNVMPAAKVVAGALTEAELAECGLERMAQRKRVRAVSPGLVPQPAPSSPSDAQCEVRVRYWNGLDSTSPGRHCHSTRSLAVVECHSLGIYTLILLSLLSFSVKMTVSPWARQQQQARRGRERLRLRGQPARRRQRPRRFYEGRTAILHCHLLSSIGIPCIKWSEVRRGEA